MAGLEPPRISENGKTRPIAGIVASTGQEGGQLIARGRKLLPAPPKRVRAQQRGRGLAQRAGLHLLPESGDSSLPVHDDIDDHPAAADRRALLDARLGIFEPVLMRNRSGKAEDVSIVEGGGHGSDIETAGWERYVPGKNPPP